MRVTETAIVAKALPPGKMTPEWCVSDSMGWWRQF